jgi:D-alanyl-lipoteichoic acid acyltransferase DltB (MBOAT superfamily)
MLFNSYAFIFFFLPITVAGFFALARYHHRVAAGWLALASLVFYGWWKVEYVALLLASIAFNYEMGLWISRTGSRGARLVQKRLLVLAVAGNLLVLAYFKYANFFLSTVNGIAGTHAGLSEIVLPLGISFFTFTQIAFLVDTYRGEAKEYNFVHYVLFVTYFPHLIAGPVLHHNEMMPQFSRSSSYRPDMKNVAVGLTIFVIGLFKKTVLADNVAPYADALFSAAAHGAQPAVLQAWGGVLAYSVQLYFDFSGYSDMAIGLSRLFGILLPLNFYSPYKAVNIIDFWRRWHMTLSRFLRDYLYIALGGSRRGPVRRYINLAVTMLLGGLWHGAGWTYVAWGALHGAFLMVNHGWHALRHRVWPNAPGGTPAGRVASQLVTLLAVIVAWVFFRANTFGAAMDILKGMAGLNGVSLPIAFTGVLRPVMPLLNRLGATTEMGGGSEFVLTYTWVVSLWAIALFAPNTSQIMRTFEPALDYPVRGIPESDHATAGAATWRFSFRWAVVVGVAAACGLLSLSRVSQFLYFQF